MKFLQHVASLLLLTTSCADFPRDPEGTLKRVQSQGSFKVGLPTTLREDVSKPYVAALLVSIERNTGAEPQFVRGDAEPLLKRLEQGELDLLIGRFEKKSPWAQRVTIGPPLQRERQGEAEFQLVPVMRKGENAWITLVEQEARNVAPEAQ